jgi:hypothetical protein
LKGAKEREREGERERGAMADRWGAFVEEEVQENYDRYLVYFASTHIDFRLPELKSAAEAEDIDIRFDDDAYTIDVRKNEDREQRP